jgi:hypothetical protein
MITLNPLDVLKSRKVNRIPPHFAKLKINQGMLYDTHLEKWIQNKCRGRYAICSVPFSDNDGPFKSHWHVGFENHKELTYFMLACPFLRREI